MHIVQVRNAVLTAALAIGLAATAAVGQERGKAAQADSVAKAHPLSLLGVDAASALGGVNLLTQGAAAESRDYREISDFFNVREANANVAAGVTELELEGAWETNAGDGNGDDDFFFTPNIKYGLTDDMFIEFEVVPLRLGDGDDQGNGNVSLQLFNQFLHETDDQPAFAAWAEARFPTADGSSKVDVEVHFNLTKTIMTDVRAHLEGFVESTNGNLSDDDGDDRGLFGLGDDGGDRRVFQWGAGVGFDYQVDDATIYTLNYLNRSSEEYGDPNVNVLEIGGVRRIADNQHVKLALDIGLDGHEETPDFGLKLQWSVEW